MQSLRTKLAERRLELRQAVGRGDQQPSRHASRTHVHRLSAHVHPAGAALLSAASELRRGVVRTICHRERLQRHVAVFMVGLPAAGKSRVIAQRYEGRPRMPIAVVDLDAEMAAHPEYDPADPDSIYRSEEAYLWADARVEARFAAALQNHSLARVVLDGTGTNAERQIRRMREARAAGWFVKVLYVRVPIRTAIDRAKLRARRVSPEKIEAYQQKLGVALRAAAAYADELEVVDSGYEIEEQLLLFSNPNIAALTGL